MLKLLSLKCNVEVAIFEMQCKVACLKCNVEVAMFEMQCSSCYVYTTLFFAAIFYNRCTGPKHRLADLKWTACLEFLWSLILLQIIV